MSDSEQTIWSSVLDDRYTVAVNRIDDYTADLSIVDDQTAPGLIVHSETVTLAYRAVFGPDVDDVAHWQERAIKVVDAL